MSFESPESSTIEGACYDNDSQVLTINFKRGPKEKTATTYVYPNFPIDEWQQFLEASSKGAFFAKHIRPIYSGRAK